MTHKEFLNAVTKQWQARAKANGWNPRTKTYQHAQLEYFMGAYVAGELLGTPLNPMILVMVQVGRDMCTFLEPEDVQPA